MKKNHPVLFTCLDLFWAFLVIGASIFGGGYAMLPALQRELIRKRGWITMDEVMDYFALAQITPGIIAVNVATFVGYKRLGIIGGILATIGIIVPGVTLMIIFSVSIRQIAEYEVVHHAFTGIRLSVCAFILNTIIKLHKGVIQNYKSIIILVIVFILSAFFFISPVYVVLASMLAGLIFFRPPLVKKDKEENDEKLENEKQENEKQESES